MIPLAVFLSGGGTTLNNLLAKRAAGSLDADFRLVISSHPTVRGVEIARNAGIPTHIVVKSAFKNSPEDYSEAMFGLCRQAGVELVVMGGFLKHVIIPPDFTNRVINIHPSLIPAFCGHGMYGQHVHKAVLQYGAKVSGCTVHFVDNNYDNGPIILQRTCPVLDDDTAENLAQRVFVEECEALPEAIRWIATGGVRVEGRRVFVEPPPQ